MSYTHETSLRVRYAETDQMGFVYYGVYAQYYEVARVEALRALGIQYANIERDHGVWMPVMNMHVRFLRPGRYDDLLNIRTTIPTMPVRDVRFRYEIRNESGELLNGAVVQLFFLDPVTMKRVEVSDTIREALIPYF